MVLTISVHAKANISAHDEDLKNIEAVLDTLSHDSLKVKYLFSQVSKYRRTNPDLTLNLLNRLDTAEHLQNHRDEFALALQFGVVYKNLSEFELSETFLLKCLKLEDLQERQVANVHMVLSNLHRQQGHWEEGMEHASEALRGFESVKDTTYIINSNSAIGFFLLYFDQIDQAIEYHNRALHLSKKIGSDIFEAIAYSNIGLSFEKKDLLDSALYYHRNGLKINKRNEDKIGMFYDYYNIARIELLQSQPEDAYKHAEIALSYAKEFTSPNHIQDSQRIMGSALVDMGKYEHGISLLEELVKRNQIGGTLFDSVTLYNRLHLAHKANFDFKKSLDYMEKYHSLEKDMNGLKAQEKINELEIQYQTEKKASTIQLLQVEKELDQQKIALSNRRFWLALIGGLVMSLLLFILYRLYQKSKNQEKALSKMLTEKEILLREVHHRVKNNLQLISSILNLQYIETNDDGVKYALQEGQNRVMSMSYIHQQLYQTENLANVDIKTYFKKLIQNLFETYNTSRETIKLDLEVDELLLDLDTLIPLGLILNELISNSLKYAFDPLQKGLIQVTLKQIESKKIMLRVADDGEGITIDLDKPPEGSFGLKMVQAFSSQIGGELEVDNSEGTCFTLLFTDQKAA